jgi:NAD(P)-dependent dehydrogenase (short-subunit alcohol dehydrogenase family)
VINPMTLEGRTILVTGASAGIGLSTSRLLAELGATVIMAGRNAERLNELRESLPEGKHITTVYDFEDSNGIRDWFAGLAGTTGPITGLVHCAGIQQFVPLRVMSAALLERMYRVNTVSAALLLKSFAGQGVADPRASIVFISSTAALLAVPANGAYGASKAALISLARTFAIELVAKGIRVNCVAPALVDTNMVEASRNAMPAELFQSMVDKHPMGIGKPEDVAHAIAFLLSGASRWITGQTLVLDGGLSLP